MRMVEKVARAMAADEGWEMPFDLSLPYANGSRIGQMMSKARAAMEAMREPDDEMAKAGIAAWEKSPMAVVTQFRAMIDKAIQESGE